MAQDQQVAANRYFPRHTKRTVAGIFVLCLVAIAGLNILVRSKPPQQPLPLPEEYTPGAIHITHDCDWNQVHYEFMPCGVVDGNKLIMLSVDTRTWKINTSTLNPSLPNIGDYFAAWGMPISYYKFPNATIAKLYFGDGRKAIWISEPIVPSDPALYEEYFLTLQPDTKVWKGFNNVR